MKPSLRHYQRPPSWVAGGMSAAFALTATTLVGSCSATIEAFDGCDHSSECVDNYWKMIWAIIILATIIYFMMLAWTCWISNRVRKKYCYLCEDLVSKYVWVNGSHRRQCQKHRMHKEFLARLPTPYASIVCPDCSERLKVWPVNRGPLYFTCDGDNCIYDGYELMNTGDTRYNCFLHDFNLCSGCVERRLTWTPPPLRGVAEPKHKTVLKNAQDIIHAQTDSETIPRRPMRKSTPRIKIIRQRDSATSVETGQADVISRASAEEGKETADVSSQTATDECKQTAELCSSSESPDNIRNSPAPSSSAAAAADNNDGKRTAEVCSSGVSADISSTMSADATCVNSVELTDSAFTKENSQEENKQDKKKAKWSRSKSYAHAIDT